MDISTCRSVCFCIHTSPHLLKPSYDLDVSRHSVWFILHLVSYILCNKIYALFHKTRTFNGLYMQCSSTGPPCGRIICCPPLVTTELAEVFTSYLRFAVFLGGSISRTVSQWLHMLSRYRYSGNNYNWQRFIILLESLRTLREQPNVEWVAV